MKTFAVICFLLTLIEGCGIVVLGVMYRDGQDRLRAAQDTIDRMLEASVAKMGRKK